MPNCELLVSHVWQWSARHLPPWVSPAYFCLKLPGMDAGGGVSLQSKAVSPHRSRGLQVWGDTGETVHGAGPTLGRLQHRIKTRSPSEGDRAANHSTHRCKLQLPRHAWSFSPGLPAAPGHTVPPHSGFSNPVKTLYRYLQQDPNSAVWSPEPC